MKIRIAILVLLLSAPCTKNTFAIIIGPITLEDCFNHATAVFSGLAVSCDTIPSGENMLFLSGVEFWTFSVGQVWKGPTVPQRVVATGRHLQRGQYPFEVGKQYVVFAYLHYDYKTLVVARVSPTAEVETAIAQRYFLGPAEVVNQDLSLPPISDDVGRIAEYKCPFIIEALPDQPVLEFMEIDTMYN